MSAETRSHVDHGILHAFALGIVLGIGIASVFTFILMSCIDMPGRSKDSAVKAGKAEYYLDADNVRQWRWKP